LARELYQIERKRVPPLPYWDDLSALLQMFAFLNDFDTGSRELSAAAWCQTSLHRGRLPSPGLRAALIKAALAAGWQRGMSSRWDLDPVSETTEGDTNVKLSEMFPRKYLSGEDLNGKAWTLTIENVTTEKLSPRPGAPPEDKYIVHFKKTQRGMVLCRTLAYQISEALGSDDTAEWLNKRITIYPESITIAGKRRLAIRARAASAEAAQL
jgi:hypothetical protein